MRKEHDCCFCELTETCPCSFGGHVILYTCRLQLLDCGPGLTQSVHCDSNETGKSGNVRLYAQSNVCIRHEPLQVGYLRAYSVDRQAKARTMPIYALIYRKILRWRSLCAQSLGNQIYSIVSLQGHNIWYQHGLVSAW